MLKEGEVVEPASRRLFLGMLAFLIVEVIVLSAVRGPEERFDRFAFQDSGGELIRQEFWRRGFAPTVDFGYLYGLLPMLVGDAWYRAFGLTPSAFRGLMFGCSLATAWGLARFAAARNLGPAGLAMIALAVPDMLQTNTISLVHNLEPALLTHALAEHARGRRDRALALATACVFVKPSMAYVYGLFLVIAIFSRKESRKAWVRMLAPAAATGAILAVVLGGVFGLRPLVNTVFPVSGLSAYQDTGYGFFRGSGRTFWILPEAGVRDYFRYEVGFWLIGSACLTAGGASAIVRLVRGAGDVDDELAACCAGLHLAFVSLFFGNRGSWVYYFVVLILGLATLSRRSGAYALGIGFLALLLLVNDGSKLKSIRQDWANLQRGRETLNLWATPLEREEWAKVRELTAGSEPVLLADYEGITLFDKTFARPVSYFDPGRVQRRFLEAKARQISNAHLIVCVVTDDWRGFGFWPELRAALEGCEVAWHGRLYTIYRRIKPPRRGLRRLKPAA